MEIALEIETEIRIEIGIETGIETGVERGTGLPSIHVLTFSNERRSLFRSLLLQREENFPKQEEGAKN